MTAGWILLLVLGVAFAAGVVYPGYRLFRRPEGDPARIRDQLDTGANPSSPLLLCLGDSITHGHVGGDWVGPLRAALTERGVLVANGGINGQQAWNLGQRLEADLRCRPSAVVLMIGSNDVMAAERPDRAKGYQQSNHLPRLPDLEWSMAELAALVERIIEAAVPHVALCTIPPLGADPNHPAERLVVRWNDHVRELAGTHGLPLLDVHEAIRPLNEHASRPYRGGPVEILGLVYRSLVGHYVLGRSWDALASTGGWGATVEGVHLSDAAAARVGALVQQWVEGLSLPSAP